MISAINRTIQAHLTVHYFTPVEGILSVATSQSINGMKDAKYPRVLLVYGNAVYQAGQFGLLVRSLFGTWPRDRLAQIYSTGQSTDEMFCGHTFQLGPLERRLGNSFFGIKSLTLKDIQPVILDQSEKTTGLRRLPPLTILKRKITGLLLNTGVWELIFAPRLSQELLKWLNDYKPEVIYCTGYSLAFCWLPIMISKRLNVPIVFHPADDWPNQLYRRSPLMHRIVLFTTRKLIHKATSRIAFSQRMAEGYYQQFGMPFNDIIMHGDDVNRFSTATPIRIGDDDNISIVYTGALGHGRWQSLIDLAEAAQALKREKLDISITAFVSAVPPEAVDKLKQYENLHLESPLGHDHVPQYLKGASILFLPETFDPKMANDIRYSITTKAHLYMLSKRPILVYGSSKAGIVDYAIREKWAYVVAERDSSKLISALYELCTNSRLCTQMIQVGMQVALRNHNLSDIQKHFYAILSNAAQMTSAYQ